MSLFDLLSHQQAIVREMVEVYQETSVASFMYLAALGNGTSYLFPALGNGTSYLFPAPPINPTPIDFSEDGTRYAYLARLGQEYVVVADGKDQRRFPVSAGR
jgi:hypothetical protein